MRAASGTEDTDISRRHCILHFNSRMGLFTLTDISSNGTYLPDGTRLPHNAPYTMCPGEAFMMVGNRFKWEVNIE